MANSVNLLVTTKNGNKTKTSTITHVNPNAADSSLTTFATTMYSLSQSDIVDISIAEKRSLDLPEPVAKLSPQLSLNPTTAAFTSGAMNMNDTPNYNPENTVITATRLGNGAITAVSDNDSLITLEVNNAEITITPIGAGGNTSYTDTVTVTVTCAETAEYASDSAIVTVEYAYTYGDPGEPTP